MNDTDLQRLVERISLESFAQPFKHQATFNARLKTTGGRYHLASHNIDINPLMLTEFSEANLVAVIKHELCHYHLHLAGVPSNHRDKEFKELLLAVGGSRYAPKTSKAKQAEKRYEYVCRHCGQHYGRKRRVDTAKYRCGKCRGKLQLISA